MRVGKLSWTSQIKQSSFSFRASKDQFVYPRNSLYFIFNDLSIS